MEISIIVVTTGIILSFCCSNLNHSEAFAFTPCLAFDSGCFIFIPISRKEHTLPILYISGTNWMFLQYIVEVSKEHHIYCTSIGNMEQPKEGHPTILVPPLLNNLGKSASSITTPSNRVFLNRCSEAFVDQPVEHASFELRQLGSLCKLAATMCGLEVMVLCCNSFWFSSCRFF